MVLEAVAAAGERAPVVKHGVPDEYCIIGPPNHCYAYYGLDPAGIAAVTTRALARSRPAVDRWRSRVLGRGRPRRGDQRATGRTRAPLQLVGRG